MALLTVPQLREHVETPLPDAAVQRLLDDAEAAITAQVGPVGTVSETIEGGYSTLILSRPVGAITSITANGTTLAANDYRAGSYVLTRLGTGTNPASYWAGSVVVTYTPVADTATRQRVQVELVRLALTYNPGLTSETIGDWSQSFATGSGYNYQIEREAILATLGDATFMAVV